MYNSSTLILVLLIISACTCGGKTECHNRAKIAVLKNFGGDECKEKLGRDDLFEESEDYRTEQHNYTFDKMKIEILPLNTCRDGLGLLKAIFKSIVWSGVHCLKPPYFLGFVGPNHRETLNITIKITSALNIPHITSIPFTSYNTHFLQQSEGHSVIQVVFKLIDVFGWKSLNLKYNPGNIHIENIVNHFVEKAADRNLCILPGNVQSLHVVYFGDLVDDILNNIRNSSIIIISEEYLENKIKNIDLNNSLLLLDNIRISRGSLDAEKMTTELQNKRSVESREKSSEDYFTNDAISLYIRALSLLCKSESKNCYTTANYDDWNKLIADTLLGQWYTDKSDHTILTYKIRTGNSKIRSMGRIKISNNNSEIYWNDHLLYFDDKDIHKDVPLELKNFISNNESIRNCGKKKEFHRNKNYLSEHESTPAMISEMTDSEWWTMVSTVTGVGIAMFSIGFFAVYVVYTNIRGPRNSKGTEKPNDHSSSFRRVGSEKQSATNNNRNLRGTKGLQRRDSRNSIRSNISEKSV